eukprot:XP_001700366.1 predicted protein [Chlamydomonas reinhardtii]
MGGRVSLSPLSALPPPRARHVAWLCWLLPEACGVVLWAERLPPAKQHLRLLAEDSLNSLESYGSGQMEAQAVFPFSRSGLTFSNLLWALAAWQAAYAPGPDWLGEATKQAAACRPGPALRSRRAVGPHPAGGQGNKATCHARDSDQKVARRHQIVRRVVASGIPPPAAAHGCGAAPKRAPIQPQSLSPPYTPARVSPAAGVRRGASACPKCGSPSPPVTCTYLSRSCPSSSSRWCRAIISLQACVRAAGRQAEGASPSTIKAACATTRPPPFPAEDGSPQGWRPQEAAPYPPPPSFRPRPS